MKAGIGTNGSLMNNGPSAKPNSKSVSKNIGHNFLSQSIKDFKRKSGGENLKKTIPKSKEI